MGKRESMAGKGRALFFPQAEAEELTAAAAEETRAVRRAITARIPADLWERLDAFYRTQPREVTKDHLLADALRAYLDGKGA